MLDDLLQYHAPPESTGSTEFVAAVMLAVERQQKLRSRILLVCGVVGAAFGVLGASLLAGDISRLAGQLFNANSVMVTSGVVVAALGALAWLLHDEPVLSL